MISTHQRVARGRGLRLMVCLAIFCSAPLAADSVKGAWSALESWPLIAIHAVLTPDGRVLTYSTAANRTHARSLSFMTSGTLGPQVARIQGTTWTDTTALAARRYTYAVKAYDAAGYQSARSAFISITAR